MSFQSGEILFDKYRIESLIGQGAFGEVYRVTHINLKGCAIWILIACQSPMRCVQLSSNPHVQ